MVGCLYDSITVFQGPEVAVVACVFNLFLLTGAWMLPYLKVIHSTKLPRGACHLLVGGLLIAHMLEVINDGEH